MNRVLLIASEISCLKVVEEFIQSVSCDIGIGKEAYGKVIVAVMEAVNNAILHGNGNNPEKKVKICFDASEHELTVEVTDEGDGFRPENVPDPTKPENIESISGRGVFLMSRLSDRIEYNAKGNSVKMLFNDIAS
jgi:serine/threonine-protein kinase RsbW